MPRAVRDAPEWASVTVCRNGKFLGRAAFSTGFISVGFVAG